MVYRELCYVLKCLSLVIFIILCICDILFSLNRGIFKPHLCFYPVFQRGCKVSFKAFVFDVLNF